MTDRVGKTGVRARHALVKLVLRQLINQQKLNKKRLKTATANTDAKVFITEDLTPLRYKLLMIAKPSAASKATKSSRLILKMELTIHISRHWDLGLTFSV